MRRLATIAADWAHVAVRWPLSLVDRTTVDSLDDGDRIPIVLLPGIWEPWRFLLPLAKALNASGHPIHPVPALRLNGAPLEASAEVVAEAIAEHAFERAVIVAHSKGGLIGKSLMLHPSVGTRIAGMVALCSPFAGSRLAVKPLAHTPLGLFSPTNETLLRLGAEVDVNARVVSIGAQWDEVVPDGTELEGAKNITLDIAGHFRPLTRRSVHDLVSREVEQLAARGEHVRSDDGLD